MTKFLFIFTLAISGSASDLYRIAGTIVDSETHQPVPRARLTLTPGERGEHDSSLITASDGKFSFTVPAGRHGLIAELHGLRQSFGEGWPGAGFGESIIAGPGQKTDDLEFILFPHGAITGKVLDGVGEPVENALVQLIRVSIVGGKKRFATSVWSRSDDRGEYRFWSLSGGSFYLVATAEPWYFSAAAGIFGKPPAEASTYAASYYPNTSDPRGAAMLVVKPGEEAHADFTLASTPSATLHIHAPESRTSRLLSLITDGIPGVEGYQRSSGSSALIRTCSAFPPAII